MIQKCKERRNAEKLTSHDKAQELKNAEYDQQHYSAWDCLKSSHDHCNPKLKITKLIKMAKQNKLPN